VGNTGRTWMLETSAARAQTTAIARMVSPASSPERELDKCGGACACTATSPRARPFER